MEADLVLYYSLKGGIGYGKCLRITTELVPIVSSLMAFDGAFTTNMS